MLPMCLGYCPLHGSCIVFIIGVYKARDSNSTPCQPRVGVQGFLGLRV